MTAQTAITTEPAPRCAACGAEGSLLLHDCYDYLCGLPGRWSFSRCCGCHSLWPNPRPVATAVPFLYPENYGNTRTPASIPGVNGSSIAGAAKSTVLAREFGYDALVQNARNPIGRWLGQIFRPILRRKAGSSVRFLKSKPGGKLLDVGCGNGSFLAWMKQLGWDVQGIELDPLAAQQALARGIRVDVADLHQVPLQPESFDAVTMAHVLEHFADPRDLLEILHRSLKPGGILVSVSPNPVSALRRVFGNKWYALDPPRHLFLPTAAACRRLLEPLGFEVQTWTRMGLFYGDFKESLSIARKREVGGMRDSAALKMVSSILAALCACLPESGEELVCFARKS